MLEKGPFLTDFFFTQPILFIRKPRYHKGFPIVTEAKWIVPAAGTDKRLSNGYSICRKQRFCFLHKESHAWTHVWFRRPCASTLVYQLYWTRMSALRLGVKEREDDAQCGTKLRSFRWNIHFGLPWWSIDLGWWRKIRQRSPKMAGKTPTYVLVMWYIIFVIRWKP